MDIGVAFHSLPPLSQSVGQHNIINSEAPN